MPNVISRCIGVVGWFLSVAVGVSAWAEQSVTPMVESASSTLAAGAVLPGWRISGTVQFPKTGIIYIAVATEDQWRKGLPTPYECHLAIPAGLEKGGVLPFEINAVQPGKYCIKAYQDVNQNAKLDFLLGPSEPVGMYRNARPTLRPPRFEEMAFTLERDLSDIRLDLK